MGTVTTCLADLGAKYGLTDLDKNTNETLFKQSEFLEEALRDMSLSTESRSDMIKNITKNMSDTYKQAILEKAYQKTTEATLSVNILDKAKQLGGKDYNASHLKKAATQLIWGEGGSVMFQKRARKNDYATSLYSRLLEKDAYTLFKKASSNKSINEELSKLLHDLSDGVDIKTMKFKHFTPEQAEETYKAIRFVYDRMFFDKKQAGINIFLLLYLILHGSTGLITIPYYSWPKVFSCIANERM